MTVDLHTFLRTRRSVRLFRPDPVPEAILKRIIETATYAPSAHNKQPWRFVVLTSTEAKSRLSKAIADRFRNDMVADGIPEAKIQTRIESTVRRANDAPVIIVLCLDVTQVNPQPEAARQEAETTMGTQSVALAGLQLLLAAHAEGLGGNWICWPLFAPDETRNALKLEPEWAPQGMIFLGYPAEKPETPEKMGLNKISIWF
jgi:coenzyme F420-0:L-glutamate ligase / coenzyme F420-1:gamma-L-glutamate ligase